MRVQNESHYNVDKVKQVLDYGIRLNGIKAKIKKSCNDLLPYASSLTEIYETTFFNVDIS